MIKIIKKKENPINDKNLNNNNLKLSEKINDELYPGEEFNIKVYNDSKIPSKKEDEKPFCSENIYINNLNIFENNYLGQICKNQNNNVIETEKKSKSEEKKNNFTSLVISSESTMQIDSSYENINKITNFNYISDDELRKKTKQFLIDQCTLRLSVPVIHNSDIKKSKSISPNNSFIKIKADHDSNLDKTKSIDKTKLNKKRASFQSVIPRFQGFKFAKFQKLKDSASNYKFMTKINNTIEEKESNNNKKKNLYLSNISNINLSDKNISNKLINNKKIKKNKEIEVISNNIKRNTQNLNNPQEFYSGLFNNIIEKQKKLRNSVVKKKVRKLIEKTKK
jgi:hypothetical protein